VITCSGRQASLVIVETTRGDELRVYFDISRYYGKF
jgi:hypothetical protein